MWNVLTAFGLAAAIGLHASGPIAILALLAHVGLITLPAPFVGLGTASMVDALVALAISETVLDLVPGPDALLHKLLLFCTPAVGALTFAATSGVLTGPHSVELLVLGALVAGGGTAAGVHVVRTTVRALARWLPVSLPLALGEDAAAVLLMATALLAPPLVPIVLLVLVLAGVLLLKLLLRAGRRALGELWDWARRLLVPWGLAADAVALPPSRTQYPPSAPPDADLLRDLLDG